MKYLSKIAFAIVLSLTFFSCNNNDSSVDNDTLNSSQEMFASKTIEIFEELTTTFQKKMLSSLFIKIRMVF